MLTTKHSFGSRVWLSMEEDNLHVTEDRTQSLVRGIYSWRTDLSQIIGPGKISNLVPLKLAEN
jgi:hypothetical protein